MSSPPERPDVDVDALREVLDSHPVRLAVLFGSAVRDETHARSDLDIVVEVDNSVDDETDVYLPLLTDITSALGRDDVDLSFVHDIEPRVGFAAFREGLLLVGTSRRKERHLARFERAVAELGRTQPTLRERFDAVVTSSAP